MREKFRVKQIVYDRWWPDVIGEIVRVKPKMVIRYGDEFWEYDKPHQQYLEIFRRESGV